MNNLFLWFADASERRIFLLRLLELEALWANKRNTHNLADQLRDLADHLQRLESGMRHSPYFDLSSASVAKSGGTTSPWAPFSVFQQGFRRIYTLRSYRARPGSWLVLQFQSSQPGRAKHRWVVENSPPERIGLAIPLLQEQKDLWWLEQAERLLYRCKEKGSTSNQLQLILNLLNRVLATNPQLYSGEKLYLWEELADAFFHNGDLLQMENCLRAQAGLQPGCSDAYLNLGYYLDRAGFKEQAISAYWEGLRVDPEDQYIIYNLAELHRDAGEQEKALEILDQAIERAQDPAILFKVKGDVLLQWGQFALSAMAYELALERLSRQLTGFRLEIYLRLSTCHQRAGNLQKAVQALERGLTIDANNLTVLHELTRFCCMLKRFRDAVQYGERLLLRDPGDSEVCFLLGVCYEQLNDLGVAKWYRMRGEREARKQEA